MPSPDTLADRTASPIATATATLVDGGPLRAWLSAMRTAIRTGHTAAFIAGLRERGRRVRDASDMTKDELATLRGLIDAQLEYLTGFATDLGAGTMTPAGTAARAAMYARATRGTYYSGATFGLPLPAMPCEGTQCRANCRCSWDVTTLDGDGNADAYWRIGANDNCQTCIQRAADWAPVRVRGGVLQL